MCSASNRRTLFRFINANLPTSMELCFPLARFSVIPSSDQPIIVYIKFTHVKQENIRIIAQSHNTSTYFTNNGFGYNTPLAL